MIIVKKAVKKRDTIDKKIVTLSKQGKTAKEIARDINLSVHKINARIGVMMQYYECKSKVQLISKLK